jgi:hypothetical protein
MKAGLPTVAVHDLTVHPRENDLVLGTYGRGLFLGDIRHLQELTPAVLQSPLHMFDIEPRTPYQFNALGNFHLFGDGFIEVPNEPDALTITYFVRDKADAGATVTVADVSGATIVTLKGPAEPGLNRVSWNMRRGGTSGGGRGGAGVSLMPAGDYRVTVAVGEAQQTKIGRIRERLR